MEIISHLTASCHEQGWPGDVEEIKNNNQLKIWQQDIKYRFLEFGNLSSSKCTFYR